MKKIIFLLLLVLTLPLYAQDGEEPASFEDGGESQDSESLSGEELPSEGSEDEGSIEPSGDTEENETPMDENSEESVKAEVPSTEQVAATINSEIEVEEKKKFNPRKNHWLASFAFEQTHYEVVPEGYEFEGSKSSFKTKQQELWGGRLGFGGELYLGGGVITRTMVEGFYVGTLFSRVLNGGDEDVDIKFAFTKRTGQIYGVDATQSLGWMFDFKTKNPFMDEWAYLTFEPFVEAGIGKAWAHNRINYSYDLDPTHEFYKLTVKDDLINARIGGGFHLTSIAGFFLTVKATINRYDITKRKISGAVEENGQDQVLINDSDDSAKIDPVVIYSLGGGYKF